MCFKIPKDSKIILFERTIPRTFKNLKINQFYEEEELTKDQYDKDSSTAFKNNGRYYRLKIAENK